MARPSRARHAHYGALAYGSLASGAWREVTPRSIPV